MTKLLVIIVKFYQKTLSPDHGWLRFLYPHGYCQYYPSCSAYAAEAITLHGWRGVVLATKRVLRCNPWSKGGLDYVPRIINQK